MMHSGGWWQYIYSDEEEKKPKVTRSALRRVADFARPYQRYIILMLVAIIVSSLLGLIPPLLYRDLIDHALPNKDLMRLNLLALGLIAIPLIDGLIGVGQRWISSRVGEGVIADLRKALYAHMQRMSLRFYTNTKTGALMSRLDNDVLGAQRAVTSTLVTIVTSAFQVVAILVIMLSLEWRLTIVSLIVIPLFYIPSRRVARVLRELVHQQYDLDAKLESRMNETLNVSGALLVKLFGKQPDEIQRFNGIANQLAAIGVRQALVGRWFFMALGLITAIGAAVVYWGGGILVMQGAFTVGTIIAFAAYLQQLYGPIASLTNSRIDLATSLVSFERVFEMLDLPVEIQNRKKAEELVYVRGEIKFDNVTFSYLDDKLEKSLPRSIAGDDGHDGRNEEIAPRIIPTRPEALNRVSFDIRAGQLAALVGPSGAGKTTITYLIPRLYDPTAGRVLIDNHDLRDVTLESLTRQIGMVTQETYLFHDTLRANLLYAKPDATQDEIERASRAANIYDFIMKLPKTFDTVVGERGYRLSGGEKQRVAIARVILKDPCILVLDEATSNLDSESEALIQAALKPLMKGRTSVVIAHRLSTILAADVILVVSEGQIVEHGTHQELLAQNGLYARLYFTQFRDQSSVVAA
jgi:ATP-binding cassette, subfamily B, bacterial